MMLIHGDNKIVAMDNTAKDKENESDNKVPANDTPENAGGHRVGR